MLNATVTAPTAVGWFALAPAGKAVPEASNINFVAGQTVANLTTTRVGTNGSLTVATGSSGSTHALADVAGYFIR